MFNFAASSTTNQTRAARTLRSLVMAGSLMAIVSNPGFAGEVRANHVIDKEKITLGDLFTGLTSREANIVLMRAPAPGGLIRFSALELDQIALEYGIALTLKGYDQSVEIGRKADPAAADTSATALSDAPTYELLPVALQEAPEVAGDSITLGDLVDGFFDGRSHRIGDAPEPGKTLDIPVAYIEKLATSYDLALDTMGADKITVKRKGTIVDVATLSEMLHQELTRDFPDRNIDLSISGYDEPLYIPVQNRISDVFVSAVQVNGRQDRFQATLFLPTSSSLPKPATIRGELLISENYSEVADATRGLEAGAATKVTSQSPLPASEAAQPEPTAIQLELARSITLIDDVIRLGDVFPNVPNRHMNEIVDEAPKPGQRSNLALYKAARFAEKLGYEVNIPSHITRVNVIREGVLVTDQEIRSLLMPALENKVYSGEFEIGFNGRRQAMFLPLDKSIQDIQVLQVEVRSGATGFNATLQVPTGQRDTKLVKIFGTLRHLVEAPVANKSLRPGDILRADMISWRKVTRSARLNVTDDLGELIGKTVKKTVLAGAVIDMNNVKRPNLISKGTPVTIQVSVAGMRLSTVGKALEDGAMGDLIQVRNLKSEQTIDVRVVGTNRVEPALITLASGQNNLSR